MSPSALGWGAALAAAAGLVEMTRSLQAESFFDRCRRGAATVMARRALMIGCGLLLAVMSLALAGVPAALVVGLVPPAADRAARRLASARRAAARLASIPDEVRALADSLSVGLPFERAALEVSRSGSRAARDLAAFAAARAAGATVEASLAVLTADDRRGDWAEVAAAVALNRRCGGDLVTPLRGIAAALEMEEEGRKEARAAMSQARFTATLVCSLPLMVAVGGELLRPGTASAIASSPVAASMAVAAVVLQGGSMAVISRISTAAAR